VGRVSGKVALVTGAAMGMGKSHSELLAREGAHVFVTDRDVAAGEAVAKGIVAAGGKADFIKHDVASEADWANAIATVRAKAGRLDILVNNAGVLILKPLHETTPEEFDLTMNVNVKGVYLGIRAAVPLMKEADKASIVNISSIYGIVVVDHSRRRPDLEVRDRKLRRGGGCAAGYDPDGTIRGAPDGRSAGHGEDSTCRRRWWDFRSANSIHPRCWSISMCSRRTSRRWRPI